MRAPSPSPPTPPPEFDLTAWLETLEAIEHREPARLALIPFGVVDDVARHLEELRTRLREWAALDGVTEAQFTAAVAADVESGLHEYERAMPFWQSYAGLVRADLAARGLTGEALVIARALQRYGFYFGDSGGTTALKLENTVAEGRGRLWRVQADALCGLPFTPAYWDVVAEGYDPSRSQ